MAPSMTSVLTDDDQSDRPFRRTLSPVTRTPSPCISTSTPTPRARLLHRASASARNSCVRVDRQRTCTIPPTGLPAPTPTSEATQFLLQRERKICNLDLIMFWFVSDGPEPINELLRPGLRFADLYLHLHGALEVQIWIWNGNGTWEMIEQGYVHPQLPDCWLWLPSRDEPSWITRKTASTYKGRQLKDLWY